MAEMITWLIAVILVVTVSGYIFRLVLMDRRNGRPLSENGDKRIIAIPKIKTRKMYAGEER